MSTGVHALHSDGCAGSSKQTTQNYCITHSYLYVMHAYVAYVTRTMCPHACVRAQMCAEHAWVQLMMLATYTVVQATHVLTMLTCYSLSK